MVGPHDVRHPRAVGKRLVHPTAGALRFEVVSLPSNDDPALKLAIYTPVAPGAPGAPVTGRSARRTPG